MIDWETFNSVDRNAVQNTSMGKVRVVAKYMLISIYNDEENSFRKGQSHLLSNNDGPLLSVTEASKSNIPCCAQHYCMTHIVHEYAPDSRRMRRRHIRESDANVARTCRAKSAQQGMLLWDPSVSQPTCNKLRPEYWSHRAITMQVEIPHSKHRHGLPICLVTTMHG
jgi:hypothetical protein